MVVSTHSFCGFCVYGLYVSVVGTSCAISIVFSHRLQPEGRSRLGFGFCPDVICYSQSQGITFNDGNGNENGNTQQDFFAQSTNTPDENFMSLCFHH